MTGIILAALAWGTTGTAAALLPAGIGSLTVGAATMGIGGILLALTAPRHARAVLADRGVRRLLIAGAMATAVYPLAFYAGMSLAGVAIGNVVALGTAPLFSAVIERFLVPPAQRVRPSLRWGLSAAAAVLGVVLLAVSGGHASAATSTAASTSAAGTLLPGVLLGLLAGVAYAGYTCTAARIMACGHTSRGTMAAQFGLAGVLLLPVLILTGAPLLDPARRGAPSTVPLAQHLAAGLGEALPLAVLAYLAIGPMMIAYILFGRGLRTVPGSRATTVTLLEPLTATVLAVLLLGERLAPVGWLGLALVLIGVVVTAREKAQAAAPAGSAVGVAGAAPGDRAAPLLP